MVAPAQRHPRRSQAETPLIDLSEFRQPPLFVKIVNEGIENIANFFVCSFSKDGNDLSQWRSYADDGRGYVLGFDTQALEQAFGKTAAAGLWGCSTFSVWNMPGRTWLATH
jgi:hypothetical protein